MSTEGSDSTICSDIVFQEFVNSYSCDEIVLDVFYNGCFLIYPLKYDGEALELKISKVNKFLEDGLTIVKNDRDVKKMYEMANLHGLLEVYISHIPQLEVTDYYFKNLCVDESNAEVTSQLRSHQKIKKEIDSYSLEEMIAWEQEETQSPGSDSTIYSDIVFREFVNSYSCDEIVLDVFYNGCFLIYPLKYGREALELKLSKVNKLSYKQMCDLLLEKVKEDIWHWFYCKPDCSLEEGLTIVENDRDVKKMYEMANLHGLLEVYVSHTPQLLVTNYYLKNLCVDEYDAECVLTNLEVTIEKERRTSSLQGVNGAALTELMQLSGETKIANFMKLFFNQHIVEDKLFAKVLRDQTDHLRSRLTKMNQMKCKMEAKEDQDAVFDSLDGLMDTIKRDSDVLVDVTQLQELVKNGIREKENNVVFMNLAD
ncbi:hypothetical protein Tco_0168158 [Tanacetum coccineum]